MTRRIFILQTPLALLAVWPLAALKDASAADAPTNPSRPAIYDTKADGTRQIDEALAVAAREKKRVLLQFGANWCGWCHRLHGLFQTNQEIARILKENYVVVLIDVDRVDGKPHNADVNNRYGNPTRYGLPALVVLEADGKALHTQDTGQLEDGPRHDPAKVIAFLEKWKPAKS
jgi:thiol:disulfide interchange protein